METAEPELLTFGPVPSRRLGRSLGINNIPPKSCSYSCIYCQVGSTTIKEVEPRAFYQPEEIQRAVVERVEAVRRAGETIDYLTFVPDGEPTLDINLGETLELLQPIGIKIAVISNASLVWSDDIQDSLRKADWVSLKVDTIDEDLWRKINRPHNSLKLPRILEGITRFAQHYTGELTTETMLVRGINDSQESVAAVGDFLGQLLPSKAYLAVPTRPPTVANVRAPSEEIINRAFQVWSERVTNVEYLIGYEGDAFTFSGDAEQDLLAILSVHPMREEAVTTFLAKAGVGWDFVSRLVSESKIKEVNFANKRFYVRPVPGR